MRVNARECMRPGIKQEGCNDPLFKHMEHGRYHSKNILGDIKGGCSKIYLGNHKEGVEKNI